jgi:spermidine dehydrogenase
MSRSKENRPGDEALGMNQRICRRDFLNSALLASGGLLLGSITPQELRAKDDWTGYGGVGDYANSNGNTFDVVNAGHQVRDNVFSKKPPEAIETGEVFDCVIVGGGISGIATALRFHQQNPKLQCLILENHPIFGGEAKQNEFLVDGQRLTAPQGSDHFRTPVPGSFIAKYYDLIGVDITKFEYQLWSSSSPEIPVGRSFEHIQAPYGLYFGSKFGRQPGMWLVDPWTKKLEGAPMSEAMRAEILKYRDMGASTQGQRSPELDTMTMEDYMIQRFGLSRETIRTFFMPGPGDGHGIGPDVLSAYAFGFGSDPMNIGLEKSLQSFPGGNCGIARHMVKTLIPGSIPGPRTLEAVSRNRVDFSALDGPAQPARIRLDSTVVGVRHDADPKQSQFVSITYTRSGKVYRLKARSVVMAGGNWTTKHIVLDLPSAHHDAYDQFHRSPCMLANIALRNWRFLYKLGVSGAFWFEGLGNYASIRKVPGFSTDANTIGPDSPVVMTLKVLYCRPGLTMEEQQSRGRAELLSTSYRDYERRIRVQTTEMFSGTGFSAKRDLAGIILNRWGHAYASPQPGFFFGKDRKPSPREILRNAPFGRIAFANTDLAGSAGHTNAIAEGERAARQLLDGPLLA